MNDEGSDLEKLYCFVRYLPYIFSRVPGDWDERGQFFEITNIFHSVFKNISKNINIIFRGINIFFKKYCLIYYICSIFIKVVL